MLLIRLLLSISIVVKNNAKEGLVYAAHCSKCQDDQEDYGITNPIH